MGQYVLHQFLRCIFGLLGPNTNGQFSEADPVVVLLRRVGVEHL